MSADGGRRWRLTSGALRSRTAGVGVSPRWPHHVFAATLDGVFVGDAEGTTWKPLAAAPAWWGPIDGFDFLESHPDTIFGVAHDGVVAGQALDEGPWVPVAIDGRLSTGAATGQSAPAAAR